MKKATVVKRLSPSSVLVDIDGKNGEFKVVVSLTYGGSVVITIMDGLLRNVPECEIVAARELDDGPVIEEGCIKYQQWFPVDLADALSRNAFTSPIEIISYEDKDNEVEVVIESSKIRLEIPSILSEEEIEDACIAYRTATEVVTKHQKEEKKKSRRYPQGY